MADVAERLDLHDHIDPGTRVEVRQRFDASWARGFEVVELTGQGYRLRRLSDGSEIPATFDDDDVRAEKRKSDMWWY